MRILVVVLAALSVISFIVTIVLNHILNNFVVIRYMDPAKADLLYNIKEAASGAVIGFLALTVTVWLIF